MDLDQLARQASAGSCSAQTTLGLYYLFGYQEIVVNYDEAFRLLSLAAEQGASRAIVNLGDMYAAGLGTAPNIEEAIELYERVGNVEFFAALELGRIYSSGEAVPPDLKKAAQWYEAVTSFEGPTFNYEQLSQELLEAKAFLDRHPYRPSGAE